MPVFNSVKKHIYTVSEITKDIKTVLENNFFEVCVEGEVSNFRRPSSGHIYFDLKDQKSILHCAFFKGAQHSIKFEIENGLKVLCFGRISVYEVSGHYQFYVDEVEPKGVGALQLAFEQLKLKLEKEGLFDETHKAFIPFLPSRIGIVTSPTGAAIRDILNVLSRRFVNLNVILYPVMVQGEGAAQQIAQAIDEFNKLPELSDKKIDKPDVLIVGRGGGSLEDLWAFNEEIVARAIYNSEIPVISAVGHEIDWTIADFVADLRAPTPSAAAELVVARKEELVSKVDSCFSRLNSAVDAKIDLFYEQLINLKQAYVLRQPLNFLAQHQQRIDDLAKSLSVKIGHLIEINSQEFKNFAGRLNVLSPLGVLSRGYSITRFADNGAIIKDSSQIKKGDEIITKLHKGEIRSTAM